MAPRVETVTLTEIAAELEVTTRTVTNYVQAGMPHRRTENGDPQFIPRECQRWLRETEIASAVERERSRLTGARLDKDEELAGKYRIERLMKQHEYEVELSKWTATDETQAIMD